MEYYECYGELVSDGHLKIPEEIVKKISNEHKVRLIILSNENDNMSQLDALNKMNGLLSDITNDELNNFDETLKKRVSLKNRVLDL
ncbi:MAG: hypothetical protein A2Y34_05575 [Spirochaetes bacterium GWC1_27_15]|nr:MAG: hypothetical protein A2Z98_07175 [Spirochaetes bacterium GWB1_27_13]OHD22520.1 MAG: hypothetical protein A2Y34_05575 [Spirochaetes bacterium GWC1_27_15]